MFNTSYNFIRRGPEHVSVSVKEQRAPTDEAVKLLKEMQDKAVENLLQSIPLKSNEFEGQLLTFKNNLCGTIDWVCLFKINGKSIEVRGSWEEWQNDKARVDELMERIARAITGQILQKVLTKDIFMI